MGRFPTSKLIFMLALCALASHGQAQTSEDFPTRPIRMLVGFSAGGATDVQARLIAQLLSERLGQTVIIENRPGAGGSIASGAVAKAQPDGYTLLYTSAALAINSALYSKLPFDPVADFSPIGTTTKTLNALVVHPSVPARTTADFIKYVKASPGTVSMGSPGIGSSGHMAQVQFNTMAGIVVNQVPYKGTNDVVRDIVSGQIKATVDAATVYLPYLKDGALLALCVGDTTRAALMPNVPTCDESGLSGYSVRSWQGILAPARTPKPIVEKLGRELAEVLKNPGLIQKLQASGARVMPNSPDEFATLVRQDVKAFDELAKAAGIEKQ